MTSDGESRLQVEAGPIPVPVLVRDQRLRVVHTGLSDRVFRVPAGRYVVTVTLPGDRLIEEIVEVAPGRERLVRMAGALDGPEAALPESVSLVSAGRGEIPPGWRVRTLNLQPPVTLRPGPAPVIGRSTSSGGRRYFELRAPDPRVPFVEIADGRTRVAVALPGLGDCLLAQDSTAAELTLTAFPAGRAAQLAQRYLMTDDIERGALLFPEGRLEKLGMSRATAVTALIGAYLVVRLGDPGCLRGWLRQAPEDGPWAADALTIKAESAAAAGDHSLAVDTFTQATSIGIPRFTAGFSMLVSRVRQYSRDGSARRSLSADQQARIDRVHDQYGALTQYVDFTAPTTTFRNLRPADRPPADHR